MKHLVQSPYSHRHKNRCQYRKSFTAPRTLTSCSISSPVSCLNVANPPVTLPPALPASSSSLRPPPPVRTTTVAEGTPTEYEGGGGLTRRLLAIVPSTSAFVSSPSRLSYSSSVPSSPEDAISSADHRCRRSDSSFRLARFPAGLVASPSATGGGGGQNLRPSAVQPFLLKLQQVQPTVHRLLNTSGYAHTPPVDTLLARVYKLYS